VHITPRYPRVALAFLVLLLAACGSDGPIGPGRGQPGLHVVLGAGITDTVDAQPVQALVVEVRSPSGELVHGTVVRFESRPSADTTRRFEFTVNVCALITPPTCRSTFSIDTTDANGRAKAVIRLGSVAGRAVVRLTVPEYGLEDSASFTVTPGAAARVRAITADTALDIGATATLTGRVVDRYNNTRSEVPTMTAGAGSAISVDAATRIVTARDMGTQWLFARLASFVDSTSVRVVPVGRLVVWSSDSRVVRLVNLNGYAPLTIISPISSDLGAFPRFDPTRQRITLHAGTQPGGSGPANDVIVVDTTGAPRRDIGPTVGFSTVIATRQIADGTVLVVGQRVADQSHPDFSLWRIAADNTITFLVTLPQLGLTYGGADISHDGTRVAYLAPGQLSGLELRVLNVSSGAITVLEPDARSPRWSAQDDRVAYLARVSGIFSDFDGVAVIINANGTGRHVLGSAVFSPGLAWSPDGAYVVGRASESPAGHALRLLRVSDGAEVILRFRTAAGGGTEDYFQPDWR
jgi:hypothetical protein